MKLAASLFSASLVVAFLTSLIVAGDNLRATAGDNAAPEPVQIDEALVNEDVRRLTGGGDKWYYKEWHDYACRDKDGDQGEHGDEYYRYFHLNEHECESKCDKDYDCKGFEYMNKDHDEHCEIWHEPIKKKKYQKGFKCFIKYYYDDDKDEDNENNDYYVYQDYACRTGSGGEGKAGKHWDRYYHYDKHECKEYCSEHHDCKGFEYMDKHGDEHCEIWWYYPEKEYKSGFTCYKKKH